MALAGAHLRLLRDPGGVTTGAGAGRGSLERRSGAPNIAVSCVWPSSIVAGRGGAFASKFALRACLWQGCVLVTRELDRGVDFAAASP